VKIDLFWGALPLIEVCALKKNTMYTIIAI